MLETEDGPKKCLHFTPLRNEKLFMKCAQNRRCTFFICEQSLFSLNIKEWKLLLLHITQTRHLNMLPVDGQIEKISKFKTPKM